MNTPFDPDEAGALWHTNREKCVEMFHKGVMAGDIDAYTSGLTHLEWNERINHGRMPYHSESMEDLYFEYETHNLDLFRQKLITEHGKYPSHAGYAMLLGMVCDATGTKSQEFYDTAANNAGGLAKMVHYDWQEPCPLPIHLHACIDVREVPGDPQHITMIAVDQTYAQKYLKDIVATYQKHTDQGLLIHLMDCQYGFVEEVREKTGFGITAEWPNADRNYYHAFRMIRFAHFLKHYNKKLWLCDADVLFTGDLQEIFDLPGELVWRARPGRLEPWNQLNACLFGCSNQSYADAVAGYIGRLAAENKLLWGSDQMAMWAVWNQMKHLSVSLLDDRQLCYDDREDALVNAYSGARKLVLEEKQTQAA